MDIENGQEENDNTSNTNIVCQSRDKSLEEIRASEKMHQLKDSGFTKINGDPCDICTKESEEICDTSNKNSKGDITDSTFKGSNDSGVDLNSPPVGESTVSTFSNKMASSDVKSEDFSSFTYWRTPLPDIEVDLDIDKSKDAVIHSCEKLQETREPGTDTKSLDSVTDKLSDLSLTLDEQETKNIDTSAQNLSTTSTTVIYTDKEQNKCDTTSSVKDACDKKANLSVFDFNEEEEVEISNIKLHVASVAEDADHTEEVEHIGSTHVIGQHLNESTMSVINGVVKGMWNKHL